MYKVGLVGYGFMGHMHAQCYVATGNAQITALCDVDPAKRSEAEEKYGCKTYECIDCMLKDADVDVVDICTPTYLHEGLVVKAAKAGKHIMCEKPMSVSVEACNNMIEAAKDANVNLMFGQVIRFWPEYAVIKEIIDSNKYGKILWATAQRRSSFPTSWENWYADEAKSGGAVLDLHIHDIDYLNYILGKPTKVVAQGNPGPGTGINAINTMLYYESGVRATAEAALNLTPGFPFNMALTVALEDATIKFDMANNPSLVVYAKDGEFVPELPMVNVSKSTETSGNISDLGGYFLEIKYFIDCLMAGKKPETVTPEGAMLSVKVCLAAAKSAKEKGSFVEIN